MNIFYLDHDPCAAAQYMCDKHIGKMLVESAQLLYTAHHVYDSAFIQQKAADEGLTAYKQTHTNHPCAIWVRESGGNYDWLWWHANALAAEFKLRFGKTHATQKHLWVLSFDPLGIKKTSRTTDPLGIKKTSRTTAVQCMPEKYKDECPVTAYRKYYAEGKKHLHKWTNKNTPFFCE